MLCNLGYIILFPEFLFLLIGLHELREDERWLINTTVFVRVRHSLTCQILSILLDKPSPSVQQSTIVALNFLLCLHSCISNSNESNNTNDNHSQLKQRWNENIIGNNYHLDSQSVDVGLADSEGNRQHWFFNLYRYLSHNYQSV